MSPQHTVEDLDGHYDTVLVGLVGSKAYGLDHATSDEDYLGIFQLETTKFLGLSKPHETVTNTHLDHPGVPDYTYQELGKFVKLALAGNPTILELLWLDKYITTNESGNTLLGMREDFLSDRVRDAFGGYARQQLERMKRTQKTNDRGEKYVRHMLRLLREGQHLIETGELKIRVDDPEELFAVGRLPFEDILVLFEKEDAKFRATKSILPPTPNYEKIESFLIEARLKLLPPDPATLEQLENAKEVIRTLRRMVGVPGAGFKYDDKV
jgi:predicted nucleotidyltransferase